MLIASAWENRVLVLFRSALLIAVTTEKVVSAGRVGNLRPLFEHFRLEGSRSAAEGLGDARSREIRDSRLLRNAMLSINRSTSCFGSDPDESWSRSKSLVCQTNRSLT